MCWSPKRVQEDMLAHSINYNNPCWSREMQFSVRLCPCMQHRRHNLSLHDCALWRTHFSSYRVRFHLLCSQSFSEFVSHGLMPNDYSLMDIQILTVTCSRLPLSSGLLSKRSAVSRQGVMFVTMITTAMAAIIWRIIYGQQHARQLGY